jgi:hypothetical protein
MLVLIEFTVMDLFKYANFEEGDWDKVKCMKPLI